MRENLSRRRFVEAAGAASVFALAGCTDGGNGGGDGGTENESGNESSNETNESDGLGGGENESTDESNETENESGNESNETNESDETNETGDEQTQAIRLGADVDGWQGEAPGDIEGETNPTLSLQAGTTYDLTWENLDGEEHELVIADADGNELAASASSEQEGETVSMTLDATQEMAGRSGTYYCEYHPEAMRGEISVE